jgi:hypothetical protein
MPNALLGCFRLDRRGKQERYFLLNEEDLKKQALKYIRVHQYPKRGFGAMRARDFTEYVNTGCDCDVCGGMESPFVSVSKEKLKACNITLPVCETTGRKWLRKLGADYQNHHKGILCLHLMGHTLIYTLGSTLNSSF